jgi:hypothetical protein
VWRPSIELPSEYHLYPQSTHRWLLPIAVLGRSIADHGHQWKNHPKMIWHDE